MIDRKRQKNVRNVKALHRGNLVGHQGSVFSNMQMFLNTVGRKVEEGASSLTADLRGGGFECRRKNDDVPSGSERPQLERPSRLLPAFEGRKVLSGGSRSPPPSMKPCFNYCLKFLRLFSSIVCSSSSHY